MLEAIPCELLIPDVGSTRGRLSLRQGTWSRGGLCCWWELRLTSWRLDKPHDPKDGIEKRETEAVYRLFDCVAVRRTPLIEGGRNGPEGDRSSCGFREIAHPLSSLLGSANGPAIGHRSARSECKDCEHPFVQVRPSLMAPERVLTTASTATSSNRLRRTGATMLGRMGVQSHVIETSLNHIRIESQVATIYTQTRKTTSAAVQWLCFLVIAASARVISACSLTNKHQAFCH